MEVPLFANGLARRFLNRGVETELGAVKRKSQGAAWQDYRRAAVLGNHQAQYFLALHYAAGLDGHKNLRLALAWFKRAAWGGEALCALVAPRLNSTPEEQIQGFKELLF